MRPPMTMISVKVIGDPEASAVERDTVKVGFEMEADICRGEDAEQGHDLEVAPVLAGHDLAGITAATMSTRNAESRKSRRRSSQ